MIWWQELLIFISSAIAFGILIGFIGASVTSRRWPWRFFGKHNNPIPNVPSTTNNPGLKNFPNEDHKNNQSYTIQMKREKEALNTNQKKERFPIEQGTNLQSNNLPQRKNELLLTETITQVLVGPIKKIEQEPEKDRKDKESVTQGESDQASVLIEIQTNINVATTPWDGKPLLFQTELWDSNNAQFNVIEQEQYSDLKEAYLDMYVANQIVWLFSTIGSISNELEASYRLLCVKIAERLSTLLK